MSMNLTRLDMTTKDDLTEDLNPQEGIEDKHPGRHS